jgi:hypothetical protein
MQVMKRVGVIVRQLDALLGFVETDSAAHE